jgi:hypothetical protein
MTSRQQANVVTKTIQSIIHLVIKGDIMCILSNNESEHDIVFEWAKNMVKHVMTTNVITIQEFGINVDRRRRLTLDDEIENWFYQQWHIVEHTDIFTIPEYPNTISFHGAPSFFESRDILYINPATIRYSSEEFVYSNDEEIPSTLPTRFISWLATQPPTTQRQPQPITYIKETTTQITFQSPECPICLTTKPNCITNCQHEFCRVCIDEHVEKNPTKHNCPLCRTIISTLTSN